MNDQEPKAERRSWRLWAFGIAALLLAIVVVQNAQKVPVDLLFIDTTMPLIIALLTAGILGFIIGWLAPIVRRGRRADERD